MYLQHTPTGYKTLQQFWNRYDFFLCTWMVDRVIIWIEQDRSYHWLIWMWYYRHKIFLSLIHNEASHTLQRALLCVLTASSSLATYIAQKVSFCSHMANEPHTFCSHRANEPPPLLLTMTTPWWWDCQYMSMDGVNLKRIQREYIFHGSLLQKPVLGQVSSKRHTQPQK